MTGNRRLAGFSLVELMIALVLGLIVTLAATQMFSVNQRTFRLQQAMADMQEQGQLALRFLAEDIRMSGYYEDGVSGQVGVLLSGTGASSDGAGGGNDRLTIAYHGDADCEGEVSATRTRIINSYWVRNDGALMCDGNLTASTGVALIEGVDSFQVLYGLRAAGLPPRVGRYVSAGDVTADDQVIAVKVAFLLRNDDGGLSSAGQGKVVVLDQEVQTPDDTAMRRLFQRTVAIRNFEWDFR